tara:strand:+ start:1702 stop:2280 length:579 start_codon:yes stop_codon:yes gene_type:complete
MKCAIYTRASTSNQTVENQFLSLREYAKNKGYTIVKEFADEGISGAKGRTERPQFDALIKGATKKDFDIVLAWSVCRLGRSLSDLVSFLMEMQSVGCNIYIHQSGLDSSTPQGKLQFGLLSCFAEFERSIIRERVIAGQERYVRNGGKMGRPSNLTDGLINSIKFMREKGIGIRKISKELGVGVSTIYKVMG